MNIEWIRQRPWLLLPGTLCTAGIFSRCLDTLGVRPELRYPIPMIHPCVEDYKAEFDAVMQPAAIVCGFSLGAIVAAHHADRIDASIMLLFGLNPHADNPTKQPGRLALANCVSELGGRAAMARQMPELFGPDKDAAGSSILDMAEQETPAIQAQTQLALSRPGALAALGKARFPVLHFTGSKDSAAPVELAREAAHTAPLGRIEVLQGLGHYALLEDPLACSNAITASIKALS